MNSFNNDKITQDDSYINEIYGVIREMSHNNDFTDSSVYLDFEIYDDTSHAAMYIYNRYRDYHYSRHILNSDWQNSDIESQHLRKRLNRMDMIQGFELLIRHFPKSFNSSDKKRFSQNYCSSNTKENPYNRIDFFISQFDRYLNPKYKSITFFDIETMKIQELFPFSVFQFSYNISCDKRRENIHKLRMIQDKLYEWKMCDSEIKSFYHLMTYYGCNDNNTNQYFTLIQIVIVVINFSNLFEHYKLLLEKCTNREGEEDSIIDCENKLLEFLKQDNHINNF